MHRLTELSLRYPWVTIVVALVASGLAGASLPGQDVLTGARSQLGAASSVVQTFDSFMERFGGGYPVLIAWSCETSPCEDVLDAKSRSMASDVSRFLEQAEFVTRVLSPATTPLVASDEMGNIEIIRLGDGVQNELISDRERDLVYQDPSWRRALVSETADVAGIVVETSSSDSDALFSIVSDVRLALEPHRLAGFDFHLMGQPVLEVMIQEQSLKDGATVAALTSLVIALTIAYLTRSWQAVVAVMLTIGCATAWMMSSLTILGWPRDSLAMVAPTLVLVVGAADAIHLLSSYAANRSLGRSTRDSLVGGARQLSGPCLVTTLTTGAAFASFVASEIRALAQFGVLSAIGVSAALILAFSLLPALMYVLPSEGRSAGRRSDGWSRVVGRLADFATTRVGLVFGAAALVLAVSAVGVPKLRAEFDIYGFWESSHPVRQALAFFDENLRRPDSFEVSISPPMPTTFADPDALRLLEGVEADLAEIKGLGSSMSIVKILKRLDEVVGEGSPGLSPTRVAELLLLSSFGGPHVIDPWITIDHQHARISLEAGRLLQQERAEMIASASRVLENRLPEGWRFEVTGSIPLMHASVDSTMRAQLQSFVVATGLVFVILVIYMRSLFWGAFAMLPNLIPVAVLIGAMGHLGIYLDAATAMVAPLALGIAVDDTIHILAGFRANRARGIDMVNAVRSAMMTTGRAVITTTAALGLGFLTMMVSSFQNIANIGFLNSLAIVGALVADLIVLPALIAALASMRSRAR